MDYSFLDVSSPDCQIYGMHLIFTGLTIFIVYEMDGKNKKNLASMDVSLDV